MGTGSSRIDSTKVLYRARPKSRRDKDGAARLLVYDNDNTVCNSLDRAAGDNSSNLTYVQKCLGELIFYFIFLVRTGHVCCLLFITTIENHLLLFHQVISKTLCVVSAALQVVQFVPRIRGRWMVQTPSY